MKKFKQTLSGIIALTMIVASLSLMPIVSAEEVATVILDEDCSDAPVGKKADDPDTEDYDYTATFGDWKVVGLGNPAYADMRAPIKAADSTGMTFQHCALDETNNQIHILRKVTQDTVRYADGSDDVKNVLQEYGEAIGITKSASDSVYRQLSGQDFDDGDALKNRFNSLGEGSSNSNAGNGGSSGGSRGSGSSGGGGTVGSFGGEYNMEPIADAAANETIKMSFEDLDGVMWASEAILALADKGIVNGKGDNMFAPDDPVTREEFTKILVGAMKLDNGQEVANGFADVSEDEWYFRYVNIAREEEIVSGIGDGLFGVGSPITREDMVVMLCNALKSRNVALTITEVAFEDAAEISDYAVEAVSALYNLDAVNGVSETEFMPKGIATRAQAAKVIYGVLELLQ